MAKGLTSDAEERIARDLADHPSIPASTAEPQEPIPSKIGRYSVLGMIGRGGMGVVYRAHDPVLDRDVALKTLRCPQGAERSEWVRRFFHEARSAARIRHPGVVSIHEFGESEGVVFFAMDLIDGKSFADALRDGGLSAVGVPRERRKRPLASAEERASRLPSTLETLASAAEALAHAHEGGIVHRDVKPQNILLDTEGRAYLTDFGLAKDTSRITSMTETGVQMGTAWYMSPEQARGRSKDVTPASDVFALGVVLYEVLTGLVPFHGETYYELCEEIVRVAPKRPSEIEPSTPSEVESICLKALEKEPAARFPTAREFARALRQYLKCVDPEAGIPVVHPVEEDVQAESMPPPPSETPRVPAWRRVVAECVLVAVAVSLALWWAGRRPHPTPMPDPPDDRESRIRKAELDLQLAVRWLAGMPRPLADTLLEREWNWEVARVEEARGVFGEMCFRQPEVGKWYDGINECDAFLGAVKAARIRGEVSRMDPERADQERLNRCGDAIQLFERVSAYFSKRAASRKEAQERVKAAEQRLDSEHQRKDVTEAELEEIERERQAGNETLATIEEVPRGCEEDRWLEEIEETKRVIESAPWAPVTASQAPPSGSPVLEALKWLARHQSPDGSWKAAAFVDQCQGSKCAHPGTTDYDTGVTSLSLLAFLGAGYTHLSREEVHDNVTGKWIKLGDVVKKAIRWLIANQDADGCIGAKVSKMMYNQSICAFALSEAYGMTESPVLQDAAQKAIDWLIAAQNPYKAWRYTSKCGENDSSVTGWCVMALKSAQLSGLNVSVEAMRLAKGFIDEITDKNYGKCGYQRLHDSGVKSVVPGKNDDYAPHESLSAVGMVVRTFVDHDRNDPILEMSARLLSGDLPIWDQANKTNDYCYWHWGTLALFQYDGPDSGGSQEYWKVWNLAVTAALVKNQKTAEAGCAWGSWDADDRWGFEGGRVYAVAINALTLETQVRYSNQFHVPVKILPK